MPRISWLRSHQVLALYGLVMVWLVIGVAQQQQWSAVKYLLFYSGMLILIYALLHTQVARQSLIIQNLLGHLTLRGGWEVSGVRLLAAAAVGLTLYVISHMGEVNVWQAMRVNQTWEIVFIRQNILVGAPDHVHYISSLLLKGILPCLLLISFCLKRWWIFAVIGLVSTVFAITLMQKSTIGFIFLPMLVYTILRRNYMGILVVLSLVVGVVSFLTVVASPPYRPAIWLNYNDAHIPVSKEFMKDTNTRQETNKEHLIDLSAEYIRDQSSGWKIITLMDATFVRVVLVPGLVVSQWFTMLPEHVPFAKGCGYRFMAPLLGCTHQNMPAILYNKLYPEFFEAGVYGTVNVASMMEDYANFGIIGLVLAAGVLAIVLFSVQVIFAGAESFILPFNIVYIMGLSSFSLYTSLASGGWVISLLLFLIFKPALTATIMAQRRDPV